MFTFLRSLLAVLVMISRMSVLRCNRFYAIAASSGKVAFFRVVCIIHNLIKYL